MRVLVVGGAGYIGSHTLRELRRAGLDAVVFDNYSTGMPELAVGWPVIEGDIRNKSQMREALRDIDAIIHFAAHAYVGESVLNPRKYYDNNVGGGLTLLNAAIDAGVRFFVFSSSCATYGVPSVSPIVETTPQSPINPYGATKLMFERVLADYGVAFNIKSVSLRYFNAAGADDDGEAGELHDPEPHLIPRVLQVAAGRLPFLDIFGDDYATADGTCVRDYVHVSDLAEAHVLALRYLMAGGESTKVNLGTGVGHSVREVIRVCEKVTGQRIRVEVQERRPGDPPVLVASARLAEETFGWKPKRDLVNIVESAWAWMLKQSAKSR
jgi:UDP-arabinose 4-epimerase